MHYIVSIVKGVLSRVNCFWLCELSERCLGACCGTVVQARLRAPVGAKRELSASIASSVQSHEKGQTATLARPQFR